MAATKNDISMWFDEGIEKKATHMIVVCDTFDYEDYPCYANGDADVLEKYDGFNGKNMQQVMEVYDLRDDKTQQMNTHRAMRLPQTTNNK